MEGVIRKAGREETTSRSHFPMEWRLVATRNDNREILGIVRLMWK